MGYNQKITKEIEDLTAKCLSNLSINQALYKEYDVQRGLRNLQGEGVRAGLTRISEITSFKKVNGEKIPCDGELRYQGIDIHEITYGFLKEERFGFEEVAYLMLFGSLPNEAQLKAFRTLLGEQRTLPKNFTRDVIMKAPSKDMKKNIHDINDDDEIKTYLLKLLRKEAFDKSGLIYGMGHAVYSLSDPRANIFKQYVQQLAHAKHRDNDFKLYSAVERLAPEVIGAERHIYKGVSANIDFYSGFVYGMLDLPTELYTPIFACSRIVGWSAHRIEELINTDKIIRPAYMAVKEHEEYVEMKDRK